jgi:DNA-binding transcriptional MerR regulator
MTTPLLSGDIIRETGVCQDTLRRWDQLGVLRPARDSSGRRIYSQRDLETAKALAQRTERRLPVATELAGREAGRQ